MNRTNLKNYAPQARRDFIQAMKDRAAFFGLTADKIEPVVERGDVAVIAGREHPRAVARKLRQLEARIKKHGFEQTMEAMAYTWFNRLVAIRFMELHGYMDHGYRVLSHPENKPTPEILEHAEHVDLPSLKKDLVIDLKLAGNKEGELYRLLLMAQCNALHAAMPFLFERIDDETELLLPDNLLYSDSLIRKLVREIEEEDWQQVEIIGWLYQFYISEKKDKVIGKVVASEDIPAATQLFTPNWIVKYLVQNTLGRQWLATYPQSALREQMEYYIEPAEQTPEVQEQLKAFTPTSLNPEELTLLDPACGSGHILVEAYDLLKAIYQERGYRAKDIPALILQRNLFGLEIDDRAAQLASFALMMKARNDDRRIFGSEATPNILAFEDSQGMSAADITNALNSPINKDDVPSEYLFEEIQEDKDGLFSKKALAEKGHVSQADIASLLELFENAKTFGSLIQVPPKLAAKLPEIDKRLHEVLNHGDLTHASAHILKPLLQQAQLLAKQYDSVVTNPPYMGTKAMNGLLKGFARRHYAKNKADLFAFFAERILALASSEGFVGLMTPFVWMFIQSYEHFRCVLLDEKTLSSLIRPEYHAFFESAYVPICSFVVWNRNVLNFRGTFIDLTAFYGEQEQPRRALQAICESDCDWKHTATSARFHAIPGSPIAYWLSAKLVDAFSSLPKLADFGLTRLGMTTANNDLFTRMWYELPFDAISFSSMNKEEFIRSTKKWVPYNKGGAFRKWFGNLDVVVNWENDGEQIKHYGEDGNIRSTVPNSEFYFRECITWSKVSSGRLAMRYRPSGSIFDVAGACIFGTQENLYILLGMTNSLVALKCLEALSPTLNFEGGQISCLPVANSPSIAIQMVNLIPTLIAMAKKSWNSTETAWDFTEHPLLRSEIKQYSIQASWHNWEVHCIDAMRRMKKAEEDNNQIWIDAFGLQGEVSPEVPDDQIILCRANREEDIKRVLSYAIGCMMGRYSLDTPGLIYGHCGNQGFDSRQYKTFPADDDGIIPLLDTDWGIRDDATKRLVELIGVAWAQEHLEENLKFIADSLGPSSNAPPRDTIRSYLSTGFYKHHLSMYKRRPIYWLFSSGKQRAFQCLVYLHRYQEGTLARMRTEYVIPLQGQIAARIEQLEGDKAKATSTSHRNKLQKEQTNLKKQQAELLIFEEKLKHAADQKISLDLDDGVKVNYAKFGDLLAEAKAITGGNDDE